ncbi:hypothetical protein [Archangium sp.]|jgi:hypothetical protein|uniref:hypothetical protein n=1 Tax=Archangium sp. TaxID=1872627 RepID=UPI002EDB7CD6
MSTANDLTVGSVSGPNEPKDDASAVQKAAEGLATLPPAANTLVVSDAHTNPFEQGQPAQGGAELAEALGAELAARVDQALSGEVSKELQQELAALVTLIPGTLEHLGPDRLQLLRSAVRALLGKKPNFTYAQELKGVLQKALREKTSPLRLSLWQKESPSILVVIGLGLFAYCAAPLALWVMPKLMHWGGRTSGEGTMSIEDLVLITIIGALGSVTSIMVRLQDFDARTNVKPGVLVLFGFFKPIIGMFFALFSYTLFNANLLPVQIPTGKEIYFYMTLAFITGFSERFAGDIIAQVQKRTLPGVPQSEDKL